MKKILATLMACLTLVIQPVLAQAAVERPIEYLQTDARWGSENYGGTIADSGCGPTSMAMVLNYYIDSSITPVETTKYSLAHGHCVKGKGTSWSLFSAMAEEHGLEFMQTSSKNEAQKWMEEKPDALIICSMTRGHWTRKGHFILLWNIEDGIAYINDPNSKKLDRTENAFDLVASQCKQYFCFNKEPEVYRVITTLLLNTPFIDCLEVQSVLDIFAM